MLLLLSLLVLIWHPAPIHSAVLQSRSSISRTTCQSTASHCSPNTTIVAANDTRAHFATIQAAINSLPNDTSTQTILILAGSYKEQLNITRTGPITLLGETTSPTDAGQNRVTITWAAANVDGTGQSVDNVYSSVMIVAPTLDASLTGSGTTGFDVPLDTPFGNRNFRVYNVDFTNTWAPYSDGPAHALSFSRANGGFYYCGFYSYQDTIYVGKLGNAYFYKSILAGQTDFLYGFGTAWIQSSDVRLRGCGGGITAWKGTNTTFENKYGVYIVDSNVRAANASVAPSIKGACALGRPWNSQHRSIFANTYEDGSIEASGYTNWLDNGVARYEPGVTLMAEYKANGPGFNATGRVAGGIDTLLSAKAYEAYSSPQKVFQDQTGALGDVQWIDWETVSGK
ncbi:Pectinesterase catalytic [Penicillium hispanicum]|uniref:Pectinesterase catalytic n=1 Tax=Penicillium hispanicum TaxID=1080232 RepID=UPI00254086AB|nr:Pectinesterase catalytic [Penicillium hispanicum]KAJ5594411.1 Pectinesterase catalytic [Penicillium hispanicum]